jgi:hypothetical protein
MRPVVFLPALLLAACAPSGADVTGDVAGVGFSSPQTVMAGGPFIVMVNDILDCVDLSWVSRSYQSSSSPMESDFTALQLTFEGSEILEGPFSVAGEAQVSSTFLVNADGVFTPHRGIGGTVEITSTSTSGSTEGSFNLVFDEGSLQGTFTAENCRNLKDD